MAFWNSSKPSAEWQFSDERYTAVFTTTHVLRQRQPIVYASHNENGDWQFHYGGEKTVHDILIVALEEIVRYDSSVNEIADLPIGWRAWRQSPAAPWNREARAGPRDPEVNAEQD